MRAKFKVIIGLFGCLLLFTGCISQKKNISRRQIEEPLVIESFSLYNTATGFPVIFELKKNRLGILSCESNDWRAFDDPIGFCENWKQKYQ